LALADRQVVVVKQRQLVARVEIEIAIVMPDILRVSNSLFVRPIDAERLGELIFEIEGELAKSAPRGELELVRVCALAIGVVRYTA
jgi:hypothetical protein